MEILIWEELMTIVPIELDKLNIETASPETRLGLKLEPV